MLYLYTGRQSKSAPSGEVIYSAQYAPKSTQNFLVYVLKKHIPGSASPRGREYCTPSNAHQASSIFAIPCHNGTPAKTIFVINI